MGCGSSSVLKTASYDEKKQFSFRGLKLKAKVVYVYDGDTLYLQFLYHKKPIQVCVRMLGYDSPEMVPRRNSPHRESEMKKAVLARNRLIYLVSQQTLEDRKYSKDEIKHVLSQSRKLIKVHFGDYDKYGRVLAILYDSSKTSLNDIMLQEGHGYEYDGGSKKTYEEEHEVSVL